MSEGTFCRVEVHIKVGCNRGVNYTAGYPGAKAKPPLLKRKLKAACDFECASYEIHLLFKMHDMFERRCPTLLLDKNKVFAVIDITLER